MTYTSNEFIRAVQRAATIPISQNTYTEQDVLEVATEEINISVVPQLLELNEDYLLFEESIAADGLRTYDIPYRAVGNKLKNVIFEDQGATYDLIRIAPERLSDYDMINVGLDGPRYFYIKNNQINLIGDTSTTGRLRFFYYFRPGKLVIDDRAAVVESFDVETGVVKVNKVPEHFKIDDLYDITQARTPHRTINFDITVANLNFIANEITLSEIPSSLRKGDIISHAEETIVIQIPVEIHPVLIQRVAYRILESQGDAQGAGMTKTRITEMENKTGIIIDNRIESSPQKIVKRSGRSRYNRWKRQY